MGDVVKMRYDLSISTWYMVTGREDIVEFSPIGKVRYVNVWAPRIPNLDFGLLTRVLTTKSWSGIMLIVVLFGLTSSLMKITPASVDQGQTEWSKTILNFHFLMVLIETSSLHLVKHLMLIEPSSLP